ncbi:MAG: hypothetical protein IGS50_06730 [Synechococcales cyanobacterium C42_A2020_086]|nr:hypothetical protein [Synechococcales cyanobacterium C42_A2020_086]
MAVRPTANRWWLYQKARFPLCQHGLRMAVLSIAAVGYSRILRDGLPVPFVFDLARLAFLAFIALFLLALQRRIVDELYSLDWIKATPNAQVISQISRREFIVLAIAAGLIQLGFALVLGLPMLGLLLLLWGYLALYRRDFWATVWLKNHLWIALLLRALSVPLLILYGSAHDWLTAGATAPPGLIWLLLSSWGSGVILEIGQRIGSSWIAGTHTITDSALGRRQAVSAWLLAVWLVTVTTLLAAQQISFVAPVALMLLLLLTGSLLIVWQFLSRPHRLTAQRIEHLSQLWLLGSCIGIGVLPLWHG